MVAFSRKGLAIYRWKHLNNTPKTLHATSTNYMDLSLNKNILWQCIGSDPGYRSQKLFIGQLFNFGHSYSSLQRKWQRANPLFSLSHCSFLFTLCAIGRVFHMATLRLTNIEAIMPLSMRRQTIKHKKSMKKRTKRCQNPTKALTLLKSRGGQGRTTMMTLFNHDIANMADVSRTVINELCILLQNKNYGAINKLILILKPAELLYCHQQRSALRYRG